jgi:surface antigen
MKRIIHFFGLMLVVVASQASNLRFLKDAPIYEFTPADTAMFEEAIQTALDEKQDGEKLAWQNKDTGVSGLVNPLKTFQENETTCRNLRIINRAKSKIAESVYKFCKKDDSWVAIELVK